MPVIMLHARNVPPRSSPHNRIKRAESRGKQRPDADRQPSRPPAAPGPQRTILTSDETPEIGHHELV
jgi:hypothetical protein